MVAEVAEAVGTAEVALPKIHLLNLPALGILRVDGPGMTADSSHRAQILFARHFHGLNSAEIQSPKALLVGLRGQLSYLPAIFMLPYL